MVAAQVLIDPLFSECSDFWILVAKSIISSGYFLVQIHQTRAVVCESQNDAMKRTGSTKRFEVMNP